MGRSSTRFKPGIKSQVQCIPLELILGRRRGFGWEDQGQELLKAWLGKPAEYRRWGKYLAPLQNASAPPIKSAVWLHEPTEGQDTALFDVGKDIERDVAFKPQMGWILWADQDILIEAHQSGLHYISDTKESCLCSRVFSGGNQGLKEAPEELLSLVLATATVCHVSANGSNCSLKKSLARAGGGGHAVPEQSEMKGYPGPLQA